MTATPTTSSPTHDLAKLTTQANELRVAMVEALGKVDDSAVRKLGNELAAINKLVLDIEATSQGDARTAYMEACHDALNEFELDGLELTVKYDEAHVSSAVFTLQGATFDAIKAAIDAIEKPSSVTKWSYGWETGDDGKRHQSFDFGKGPRNSTPSNANGTRTVGWVDKDGTDTTLGAAFDKHATAADKAHLATLTGGSATNAYKVKTITAAGCSKK